MRNEELYNKFKYHFNEFTLFVKMLNETGTPLVKIKTRNHKVVEVMYFDDGATRGFRTNDWKYIWEINGSSTKSSDWDLMETLIVKI